MAELHVFRLRPEGAFHIGGQGIGLEATIERCPSDTLYAALFVQAKLARLPFPEPTADGSIDDPPFRLSSCMPYAGNALLFPRPYVAGPRSTTTQPGRRKRDKKIRYVSATVLRHLLARKSINDFLPDLAGPGRLYQDGAVLIADDDRGPPGSDRIWSEDRIDHVTVDRVREASQYYAVGQVRFAAECGLYVLAELNTPAAHDLLLELLVRLGHSGLGGRRSAGRGQFTGAPPTTIDLPSSAATECAMLLSRYLPTPDELQGEVLGPAAAYELVRVSGWLQSTDPHVRAQQRKAIHLLAEGSIVQCPAQQPPRGRVVDVKPDLPPRDRVDPEADTEWEPHAVWRYGLALTIGVAGRSDHGDLSA